MFTECPPPDAVIRCDGCGDEWHFTADEPLMTMEERDDFVTDCMEILEADHDHGVPGAPGYYARQRSTLRLVAA
jgi:hypothetical protein